MKELQISINEKKTSLMKSEENINKIKEETYSNYRKIFHDTFCNENLIKELGEDFWMSRIDDIFKIGKELGKSELQIKMDLDVYLIDIYYLFNDYYKSYEYLIIMAQYNSWLTWKYKRIIPKVKTAWKLKSTLEKRILTIKDEELKKEFENYYKEISLI